MKFPLKKLIPSFRKKHYILAGILITLLIAVGASAWFLLDYYPAEDIAVAILNQDNGIEVKGDYTILSPTYPSDTAIIFYPGAKVETIAYLPLLDQIRQNGITCILVDMPFHMAFFDSNAAQRAIDEFSEIEHWYIAGHSLGGAMARCLSISSPPTGLPIVLLSDT